MPIFFSSYWSFTDLLDRVTKFTFLILIPYPSKYIFPQFFVGFALFMEFSSSNVEIYILYIQINNFSLISSALLEKSLFTFEIRKKSPLEPVYLV